jgi:plasmid stability protein
MQRANIYLTDEQRAALSARAAAAGISAAELVRRLIDQALFGGNEDLAEDLAAIDLSFGALRDVEVDVDRADGVRGVHVHRISQL